MQQLVNCNPPQVLLEDLTYSCCYYFCCYT